MSNKDSENIDIREEQGFRYHRGSALSIFANDRREDFMALGFALLIALLVYIFI